MRLWLDDVRDPAVRIPDEWKTGKWVWAKTAEDAVDYLRTGFVEFASLDHDLTPDQSAAGGRGHIIEDGFKSGYDVVLWLEQHPTFWPKLGVLVHSRNPAGRARMEQVINKHYYGENGYGKF